MPVCSLGRYKEPSATALHSLQTSKCLDMEAKLRQLVKRAVTLQNSSTVERARGGRVSVYAWHRSLQPPISIRKRHPRGTASSWSTVTENTFMTTNFPLAIERISSKMTKDILIHYV